jgi:ubiquinol-cytochrome c reductase cytochrome c subunit
MRSALRRVGSVQVPAGSATRPRSGATVSSDAAASRPAARRTPTRRLRRRALNAVRLVLALLVVGGLYTVIAPGAQAEDVNTASAEDIAAGKALYDASCISCHGRNGQGVTDRGPSIIGAGSAAVEFQVATGRMPAPAQGAQILRRDPLYSREEAQQIGAYIQSLGGGPELPNQTDDQILAGGDVARGGTLFRVNCSSCHAFGMGGGALSSGKSAPTLENASPRDIWAAMLTGPQNMPVFGNNQLSPDEKRDIVAYIHYLQTDPDPGGWGIGRLGPVAEGLAVFLIGMVALVFATLWIVGKQQ